jgi:hypothetical protein
MLPRLLAFAVFTVFAVGMLLLVFDGFRTGHIRHSDSSSTYSLRRQPIRFGLVALAFSSLAAVFICGAIKTAIALWKYL